MTNLLLSIYAISALIFTFSSFAYSSYLAFHSPHQKGDPTGWLKVLFFNLSALFALIAFFPPLAYLLPQYLWRTFLNSLGL